MKRFILLLIGIALIITVSCAFKQKTGAVKNIYSRSTAKYEDVEESRIKIGQSINQVNEFRNTKVDKVYYKGKAVVLTYHHISNVPYSGITITPERFEKDIKMLVDNGFNVISLREMIDSVYGRAKIPDNAVVITFDDGIESFYKYAYPVLLTYRMPATNFIITTRNESYTPSTNDYNPLSPAEITEMYNSGLVDIQSHTNDSHEMVYINSNLKKGSKLTNKIYNKDTKTTESEDEYVKRVSNDLTKSRDIIYKYTGDYPEVLCFPFGIYNKNVIEIAKKCGFNYFVTTTAGYNKEGSMKDLIFRIRSGDAKLDTDKLFNNIVDVANNKRIEQ